MTSVATRSTTTATAPSTTVICAPKVRSRDRGICVERCNTGEFPCPLNQVCRADGYCVDAECLSLDCPSGQLCLAGQCVDSVRRRRLPLRAGMSRGQVRGSVRRTSSVATGKVQRRRVQHELCLQRLPELAGLALHRAGPLRREPRARIWTARKAPIARTPHAPTTAKERFARADRAARSATAKAKSSVLVQIRTEGSRSTAESSSLHLRVRQGAPEAAGGGDPPRTRHVQEPGCACRATRAVITR